VRTARNGNAAEAAVLNALVRREFDVLVPFGEGQPYDLVVHLSGRAFLRVQCKAAWPHGGCLIFNCRATDHGRGNLPYIGLADLFGVYFPPAHSVYLVPIDAVAETRGRLRLEPTRNNQRRRVKFASDYEIDRWTAEELTEVVSGPIPSAEAGAA
jgi:hypothetical protein